MKKYSRARILNANINLLWESYIYMLNLEEFGDVPDQSVFGEIQR